MTKKIRSVRPVHINFWLKGVLVSGCWTSGRNGTNGLTKSRNRTGSQEAHMLAVCHPAMQLAMRRQDQASRGGGGRARARADRDEDGDDLRLLMMGNYCL